MLYKDPQLSEQNTQEKVFSIKDLVIQVTLHRLLFDEIVISKFELNEAYLRIEKSSNQLIIAGIDLNKINANNTQEELPETEPTPFLYQILLPELALKDVDLDINNNENPHQINIKELLVSQLTANLQSQQATLALQSIIDNAPLTLTAKVNFHQNQGEINSQLSITNYPINKAQNYIPELSELSGNLSFTSEQQLIITPEQIQLLVTKATLNNSDLIAGYQQQVIRLKKLENTINNLKLTLNQGEITELSGTSQLTLNQATVSLLHSAQKLAYFEQLALNGIDFHLADTPQVKISNLIIDNIYASKKEAQDSENSFPPLAALKQLLVSDIFINAQQLAIDKITLDSLQSNIIINKEKTLATLVSMPKSQTDTTEPVVADTIENQEAPIAKSPFIVSLNEFSLVNNNQIYLLDNSVEPAYKRETYIDTLYLGAFSNAKDKQEQQTPFELIGRSDKYAHFNFKGFTQPFAQQPTHHIKGSLKELSLPAVSTYMKKALNMELKSGQLNTDIDITLTGEQLKGNLGLLLERLETATADNHEAGKLIDQGALPLNMALGMLKDRHGDVELSIPLSGSTSDPQFGISSIVTLITKKAILMATQEYLMATFVPYANIVSTALTVGEFALKLRFDDVIYQIKQIEPNEAQEAYLKTFIALMQDKEKTRINICAISTPADINLVADTPVIDKNDIFQLKDIADQRAIAFKEYIIKEGKIASSRLLLCAPKIDSSANAKPRIELSI